MPTIDDYPWTRYCPECGVQLWLNGKCGVCPRGDDLRGSDAPRTADGCDGQPSACTAHAGGGHMTFPTWWPYPTPRRRRKSSGWCSPAKRAAVYARDGHSCVLCGSDKDLTIDHIRPRSKGGTNALDNLQTMCRDCNQGKADT